jgi:hypothetical protein
MICLTFSPWAWDLEETFRCECQPDPLGWACLRLRPNPGRKKSAISVCKEWISLFASVSGYAGDSVSTV